MYGIQMLIQTSPAIKRKIKIIKIIQIELKHIQSFQLTISTQNNAFLGEGGKGKQRKEKHLCLHG